MAKKDYYLILGIPREATDGHVQRAFRRLAKEHHPDRVGPESTAQFQEIAEAYEVLSDPAKRRAYDDRLGRRVAVRRPAGPTARGRRVEPLVPEPLFAEPRGFRRGPIEDLSARNPSARNPSARSPFARRQDSLLELYRFLLRF